MFRTLRLMADDMTGALDSAAGLVGAFGPLPVGTTPGAAPSAVLDTGNREAAAEVAAARIRAAAAHLAPAPGRLSFFKVDSLLRGAAAAEIAALATVLRFDRIIIAPAMPFQGRVTRGGRQLARQGEGFGPVGEDVAAALQTAGCAVAICDAGALCPSGLSFWNAETEADLDAIAAAGLRAGGATLWVGSGGLAGALARAMGAPPPPCAMPGGPVLGLVGSNHPVMLRQLAAVADDVISLTGGGADEARAVQRHLARRGAAFLRVALPDGTERTAARAAIEAVFAGLVRQLAPPGLLFVSGGETLAALLGPLGAGGLVVTGEIEPGAPLSRLSGGAWDGTPVLSKSGAFGAPDFLVRLLSSLHPPKAVSA